MDTISSFTGKYSFLSNFYECEIPYEGLTYPSAEAAFQAAKCKDTQDRFKFQWLKPVDAKRAGRYVRLRSDWESVKVYVMQVIIKVKFKNNPDLTAKLIATGDTELLEGNSWHDNFWGNCVCERCRDKVGENMLGKLLMERRHLIREEQEPSNET